MWPFWFVAVLDVHIWFHHVIGSPQCGRSATGPVLAKVDTVHSAHCS